jgi:hypothetical protein
MLEDAMTTPQCWAFVVAALGASGTAILFFSSYALESYPAGTFGSPEVQAYIDEVTHRNKRRAFYQKIGFAILTLSFITQFVSIFYSH